MGAITWFVGVTTSPRYKANYLQDTIASLGRAGWPDVIKFDDRESKLGPWENLKRAILAGARSGADFIAIFQDDIDVTKDLRDWLEKGNMPVSEGVASLYCRWEIDTGERGWQQYDFEHITCGNGHRRPDPYLLGKEDRVCAHPGCKQPLPPPWYVASGALGYVMSGDAARHFATTLPRCSGRNQSDYKIAQWCTEQRVPMLYHEPSLIQHMGVSSAAHGKNGQMPLDYRRVAKRFARTTTEIYDAPVDARYANIESSPIVHCP